MVRIRRHVRVTVLCFFAVRNIFVGLISPLCFSVQVRCEVRRGGQHQREISALQRMGSSQKLLQDAATEPHQVNRHVAAFIIQYARRVLYVFVLALSHRRSNHCLLSQEVLRGEDRHLLCLVGFLHNNAGSGCCRGSGMFHLWIQDSRYQHLEVHFLGDITLRVMCWRCPCVIMSVLTAAKRCVTLPLEDRW